MTIVTIGPAALEVARARDGLHWLRLEIAAAVAGQPHMERTKSFDPAPRFKKGDRRGCLGVENNHLWSYAPALAAVVDSGLLRLWIEVFESRSVVGVLFAVGMICHILGLLRSQDHVMATTTIVCMAVFFAGTLRNLWLFDRLLKFEYAEHRAQWERDGRPIGFFWFPSEGRVLRGGLSRNICTLLWLFKTPAWIRDLSCLRRCLWQIRVIQLVNIVAWGVLVAAAFNSW